MGDERAVSPATTFAVALLSSLADQGVRDIVVCPGSRSQALALAAVALEKAGRLRVHVRIDERSAAFFALGIGVESGSPAAIVTTSGTAVANLHPAVLEAHHSLVPLLVLSADRPEELRGIRSNQTTRQPGMFGDAVRYSQDVAAPAGASVEISRAVTLARTAVDAARGAGDAGAGPVHLNLAFREPLSSALDDVTVDRVARAVSSSSRSTPAVAESASSRRTRPSILLDRSARTIVIAGHGAGPAAEALAHSGGWPLVAEVSSGARFGRNLIVAYRELLRDDELGGVIERAVVFGHPTLSREVPALLQRDGVEVIVVAPSGAEVYNPGRRASRIVSSATVIEAPIDRAWLGAWVTASRSLTDAADRGVAPDLEAAHSHVPAERLAYVKAEFEAVRAQIDREMLVESIWRATWPHDRLVLGASRLIRDADKTVSGKKITVHANRGLAGIDGTIATALGIATASQAETEVGVTRVLVGDLALLHDAGSLLAAPGEPLQRIQVIVGNDGGGTIFDSLEVAQTASPDDVDRVLYTPQNADLAALAAAFGWRHVRATTRAQLDQALTAPTPDRVLIEVPLER